MLKLSVERLKNFPYSRYVDHKIMQRGREYYKEGRVSPFEISNDETAVCLVEGSIGAYEVYIGVTNDAEGLYFTCECPYAEQYFCKHMVAAALELQEYYARHDDSVNAAEQTVPMPKGVWNRKMDQLLASPPRAARAGSNAQHYAAVLLMEKNRYYFEDAFSFTPFTIKTRSWAPLEALQKASPQEVYDLLLHDSKWLKEGESTYSRQNPESCLNLNPQSLTFFNFFSTYLREYSSLNAIATYFPLLAEMQIPLFFVDRSGKLPIQRIEILPEPVEPKLKFTRQTDGSFLLSAVLSERDAADGSEDPGRRTPDSGKLEIIAHNPLWALHQQRLFALPHVSHADMFFSLPITVPESDLETFRQNFLVRLADAFPLISDLIEVQTVAEEIVPRLYLHDDKEKGLLVELRFAYGDAELAPDKADTAISMSGVPDSWQLLRIQRQPEQEKEIYKLISDVRFGLKHSNSNYAYGTYELRSRTHPFDFLLNGIPLLTEAGFEIYGEENLKVGRINRNTPTMRVNIVSGIDWFDLQTVVEYGDQLVSLKNIRKAMRRGEQFVKLADGSVGQIPEEWLEKYRHLWNLATETEDGSLRLNDYHLSLVDSLLEENPGTIIPADLVERRERLRNFERIAPQQLPDGFTGELRPYQKHGFDWLHFLREYRFGGILADDMGLGKTVQMLAYLLSLKERGLVSSAALLVVPKSLITNWQRESEKFTPGLTFLEYVGNARDKDTATFDGYDVILTTYGTMLRDIDSLHTYKFHHVILDESQAIKNPLAKSAKAAAFLEADHRLVMTGTPVENNTFELWSQFAFINPGLLGSMEYFKKEFAVPIESEQNEESAALLRSLVYPFILRREKEQVAPELPPRTERVLYVDMSPAQKKVYTQTRERYRAELLGMIERTGMNDARFKILEGLLRLRQISIHPALVDGKFRGDAPKFELLLDTLQALRAGHHKALIFSQFVEVLHRVRNELDRSKIKYTYLDGRTRNRQERVDEFQNDPAISFFLISLKAGGVGLNLTAADYVIHLDPWWNPAVEMQASDRAHRIGQDKPVFVYKMITRDSVEEKILQLQEKKRALVKSLITTESSFFKSLTPDDVRLLFE